MTTPARYVDWFRRADPKCPVCRGMGYARYRQQSRLSVGERVVRGIPEPTGTYESACECLAAPTDQLRGEG